MVGVLLPTPPIVKSASKERFRSASPLTRWRRLYLRSRADGAARRSDPSQPRSFKHSLGGVLTSLKEVKVIREAETCCKTTGTGYSQARLRCSRSRRMPGLSRLSCGKEMSFKTVHPRHAILPPLFWSAGYIGRSGRSICRNRQVL